MCMGCLFKRVSIRELKTGLVSVLVGCVPESGDLSLLEAELVRVLVLGLRWNCNTERWEAAISSLQLLVKWKDYLIRLW